MQLVWGQYWFEKRDFQTDSLKEQETTLDVEDSKKLYCAYCQYYITDLNKAITVDGEHTHTFSNPAGYTYTVNCFQSALGCDTTGEFTRAHTWFKGYEWQIANCHSCHEQLGWLFKNGKAFYALILDRLTHIP